jgi:hypothetical protein
VWIEEVSLQNIRCFNDITLRFGSKNVPYRWVTLLSENGGGKTTILQSLALMLAGPEAAAQLLPRAQGWVKQEGQPGKISARIHKDSGDSGTFGQEKKRTAFGYSMHVTGSKAVTIRGRKFTEPVIHASLEKTLSWLRQNAFASDSRGWFAVGYGAFRRLTRTHQIIVPSLEPSARFTNFLTQFKEDEALASFQQWLIFLDYKHAKDKDANAKRQMELGVNAINSLLPSGVKYDHVDSDGRILFDVNGNKVPTLALSDGYRSVLALAGDLVWRLIQAFPNSSSPLQERGVVLIDELDIHLHPSWQRTIAYWLRQQFPNLQFIVATHSPMVAAGAGEDALSLKVSIDGGATSISTPQDLFARSVDEVLQSEAFGVISPFSPQTQEKIDRWKSLKQNHPPAGSPEATEFRQLSLFMETHNPFAIRTLSDEAEKAIANAARRLK